MGENNLSKWSVFRKIAAISGITQGLAWLVMAAICIGMYYAKEPKSYKKFVGKQIDESTSYIDLISFCFYDVLLFSDNNYENRLLKPKYFHVFAWIYAVLSLCWLCLALTECIGLFRRKTAKYDAHILMLLGAMTLLVCILDLTVMSLAFRDYSKINAFKYDLFDWDTTPSSTTSTTTSTTSTTTSTTSTTSAPISLPGRYNRFLDLALPTGTKEAFEENIDVILRYRIGRKVTYGILITLCARGFAIWIFNCVAGVILMVISSEIFQAPPILKYDNRSIPRAKIDSYPQKDDQELFGSSVFAEDFSPNRLSTPPAQKRSSGASPFDRYGREPTRNNNPLALSGKNRRSEHMFS